MSEISTHVIIQRVLIQEVRMNVRLILNVYRHGAAWIYKRWSIM